MGYASRHGAQVEDVKKMIAHVSLALLSSAWRVARLVGSKTLPYAPDDSFWDLLFA
jgi:hypothetical protein